MSALHDLVSGCFCFVAGRPWLVYGREVCDMGGVCARIEDVRTVVVEGGLACRVVHGRSSVADVVKVTMSGTCRVVWL